MNVALLGYGYAGQTFHAPLIRAVEGLRLTKVMSTKAVLDGVAVVRSADEVFADPAVDLVVIATPNDSHFDLASRALEAGKHVVVDKPFTLTVAEGECLTALAQARGRLLSVFHNRRWDADFLTLRQVIASGELGDVMYFESHFDRYRPEVRDRWREHAGPGAGLWYDLGPHVVDQALQLFGVPDSIMADLEMQRPGAQAVDYFHVVLRYGRRRAILHVSVLVAAKVRRFAVHGTKGSFVKYGLDAQEDGLKRGEIRTPDPEPAEITSAGGAVRRIPLLVGDYPAYYEGVRDAILKGAPNPVTPEEALAVMRVLEEVLRDA